MGGVGHGFGAACYDGGGTAGHDCLRAEDDGFEGGGADFVYGGADGGVRHAGAEGALAGWVLTKTGRMGQYAGCRLGGDMDFAERTLPKRTSSTSEGLTLGTLSKAAAS